MKFIELMAAFVLTMLLILFVLAVVTHPLLVVNVLAGIAVIILIPIVFWFFLGIVQSWRKK